VGKGEDDPVDWGWALSRMCMFFLGSGGIGVEVWDAWCDHLYSVQGRYFLQFQSPCTSLSLSPEPGALYRDTIFPHPLINKPPRTHG